MSEVFIYTNGWSAPTNQHCNSLDKIPFNWYVIQRTRTQYGPAEAQLFSGPIYLLSNLVSHTLTRKLYVTIYLKF